MKINKAKFELVMAEKGITGVALAEASGISRQNISTIKQRGTCEPKTAAKLAKGLGVEVREIVEA